MDLLLNLKVFFFTDSCTAVKYNCNVLSCARCFSAMLGTISFWHSGSYKQEKVWYVGNLCHDNSRVVIGDLTARKREIVTDPRFFPWQNIETTVVFTIVF